MTISAIVLAGGRSTRFGRDKLAEPIDGEPVLWRTIEGVRTLADDIVVVTRAAHDASVTLPSGVREVHDAVADGGPLVGVLAGLEAVRSDKAIVVGGDMPWLRAGVLGRMLASLDGAVDAVALEVDERTQQLPLVVRPEAALVVARRLVASGERRLGALVEALDPATLAEADWRAMDPGAETIRDIDVPADLPPDRKAESGLGARIEDAGR